MSRVENAPALGRKRRKEAYALSAANFSCIADGLIRRYAFSIIATLVPVCAATVNGSIPYTSYHTIKARLKRIYSKTGAEGHAALIRLLFVV